ncbi:helix-turn-helix domain-containing protein [Rothia koreensis]|uniref:helix-turn-helix domain-containing protein n=1 Tax=Rothia koreensis TaxID=592378 RepID=UPI0037CACFF5
MTHLSETLHSANRRDLSSRRISELAARKGHDVHYTTISRYLSGKHPVPPRYDVLEAFAVALSVPVSELAEAAQVAPRLSKFELPDEADALDEQERQAVVNLVRVMASKKRSTTSSKTHSPAIEPVNLVESAEGNRAPRLERGGIDLAAHEEARPSSIRRDATGAHGEKHQENPHDDV